MCASDASSSSGTCIPYLFIFLYFYLALLRELERPFQWNAIKSRLALSWWHDLSSGKTEDPSHVSDFTEVGMLLEEAHTEVAIGIATAGAFHGHGVLACCLACDLSLGNT